MINIRLATEEDKEGWNRVAYESPEATYAHTLEWKEVIEEGLGLESICLVAEDKGEIIGIFPAFLRPFQPDKYRYLPNFLFRKFKVLWSPLDLTWDYGGPCILPGEERNVLEKLVVEMEKIAKKEGAIDLILSFFHNNLDEFLRSRDYKVTQRLTSITSLDEGKEEIMKKFKRDVIRGIKKSEKEGVVINCNDLSKINEIYDCLKKVHAEKNAFLPSIFFFKILSEILIPQKMARIYMAEYKGDIIGVGIYFYFKDVIVERYRASYYDFRNLYPENNLIWSAIRDAVDIGISKFDFGGMPNDPSHGIFIFKSRWGGRIKNVDWYKKAIRMKRIRKVKRSIQSKII